MDGQYLNGKIKLSAIPKEIIQRDNNNNAFVWAEIHERKQVDQYGNTHYISIYANGQTIYLGNFKPRNYGRQSAQPTPPSPATPQNAMPAPPAFSSPAAPQSTAGTNDDLPF